MKVGDLILGDSYLVNLDGKKVQAKLIRKSGAMLLMQVKGRNVKDWVEWADLISRVGGSKKKKPLRTLEEKPTKKPLKTIEFGRPPRTKKCVHQKNVESIKKEFGKILKDVRKHEAEHETLSEILAANKKSRSRTIKGLGANLIVKALAGTGKTFSLVEGVKRIMGTPSYGVKGSLEQDAIWNLMVQGSSPDTIVFAAFNRAIAKKLKSDVPRGCKATTMHGLGYGLCMRAYRLGEDSLNNNKTAVLLEWQLGKDIRQLRSDRGPFVNAVVKLVGMCKKTLREPSQDNLLDLSLRYDIDLGQDEDEIFNLVPDLLEQARTKTSMIDFDDMIWLPIVNNLKGSQVDLLLVDESQDLNVCQQALARSVGRRFILVGDENQAIYGFAGADTESMKRMEDILSDDPQGCKVLPLTETRRCGKAIVEAAKEIVPSFKAYKTNPPGEIRDIEERDLIPSLKNDDMVLCRMNAPLCSLVFRLIRNRKKATIQGRDIGDNLMTFVKSFKVSDCAALMGKVDDYYYAEKRKLDSYKHPSEGALLALQDKCECVKAFAQGNSSLEEIEASIKSIFTDDKQPGILLSSIHKAKGLEAKRVSILYPNLLPHPMARTKSQKQQERNLKYVGITRAIDLLTWVHEDPKGESDGGRKGNSNDETDDSVF